MAQNKWTMAWYGGGPWSPIIDSVATLRDAIALFQKRTLWAEVERPEALLSLMVQGVVHHEYIIDTGVDGEIDVHRVY
jgi:hypothetical protein